MLYFRLPFTEKIKTLHLSLEKDTVSFVSFDNKSKLDFKGEIKEILPEEFLKIPVLSTHISSVLKEFSPESETQYQAKIARVIQFVKENKLSKLVISRRKLLKYGGKTVNLSQSFLNLCASYPNAFVYLFLEDGKCWMGAFSEVLGKFNKQSGAFETMSLAGTLPLAETWTPKEVQEQKTVTQFIKKVLSDFSEKIEISATQDHLSGNIKHLRTDFKASIPSENLEKLVAALHPTPAVCGIPTEFCQEAISKFEAYPRNFYAGYIKVETADFVQYFVNLRCAEFLNDAAFIYVGGGVNAESLPEKEWRETELKAEAILKNIDFERKS
jgi:isochorismate synthase